MKADSFYPSYDINNCKFSNTNGVSYRNAGVNVEYSQSDLVGVSGNWIETHRFTDIANPYYPDAKRYDGIADKVAVPPNTTVDVGMWVWNYTGHNVYVNHADVFLSNNIKQSDATRLSTDKLQYNQSCWKQGGSSVCRAGRMIRVPIQTTYADRGNDFGKVIYSFQTIQPIQIVSTNVVKSWNSDQLILNYEVKVKNISDYDMCGIELRHTLPNGSEYRQTGCVYHQAEYTYRYSINMSSNYPSTISHNSVKIYDPNRHSEVVSSPVTSNHAPEERSIVVWRDDKDQSSPTGLYGAQPGWGNGNGLFSIELIPYTTSANFEPTKIDPEISIEKTVSDGDEFNQKNVSSNINEAIYYKIKVTNTGGQIKNLKLVDNFDFTNLDISNAGGSTNENGKLIWNIPTLNHGESIEKNITAIVKKLNDGKYTIENIAEVFDENLKSYGKDSVKTNVEARTSFEVVKLIRNITAEEQGRSEYERNEYGLKEVKYITGDKLLYTIIIKNTGNTYFVPIIKDQLEKKNIIQIESEVFKELKGKIYLVEQKLEELPPLEEFVDQYEVITKYSSNNIPTPMYVEDSNMDILNIVEVYANTNPNLIVISEAIARQQLPNLVLEKKVLKGEYDVKDKVNFVLSVKNNSREVMIVKLSDVAEKLKIYLEDSYTNWFSINPNQEISIPYVAEIYSNVIDGEVIYNTATLGIKDLNGNEYVPLVATAKFKVRAPKVQVLGIEQKKLATTGDEITYMFALSPLLILLSLVLIKRMKFIKFRKELTFS